MESKAVWITKRVHLNRTERRKRKRKNANSIKMYSKNIFRVWVERAKWAANGKSINAKAINLLCVRIRLNHKWQSKREPNSIENKESKLVFSFPEIWCPCSSCVRVWTSLKCNELNSWNWKQQIRYAMPDVRRRYSTACRITSVHAFRIGMK